MPDRSGHLLRVAVAAHLGRYYGQSHIHTESDLRVFLSWCTRHNIDPLAARRADVELFVRWLQDDRQFKPSTVSRRLSVGTCFYRTCVMDTVLDASPAAYVRRPHVPAESPTLGLSHLQFEAMLVAARTSANRFDFALVAMLGLLGLRIFEACASNIGDLGEEHGHRVLRARAARAARSSSCRCRPQSAGQSTTPSAIGPAGRFCSTAVEDGWTARPRPEGYATSRRRPACACRGCIRTCCATFSLRHDHAQRWR